jgi:hypothetical protein
VARIHFFEFEDLPWFPKVLRDAGTGFLNTSHKLAGLDELFIPKTIDVIQKSKAHQIVDLGSGAGGPTPAIVGKIRQRAGFEQIKVTLTDYFPNTDARERYKTGGFSGFVEYHPESVNAAKVPENLPGLRTMFLSFHHMPPAVASGILEDAQRSRQPIAIFEAFGRNLPSFVGMLPSCLVPFFIMPFVKPFRLMNLIFTYAFPLVPLLVFFDGWVSYLRTYSPNELREIVAALPEDSRYTWEIGELGRQRAPYLIGYPL